MNTEHLFGVYLAKRRMLDAEKRRRPDSTEAVEARDAAAKARASDREEASLRVFDAIRAAVQDSQARGRRRW
jgi:hypothetical protein